MVHIVFQEADVQVMQQAMALDKTLTGEVMQIKDDFAVGPLQSIYEPEGYQQRRNWWQSLLEHSPYTNAINLVDDKLTVHQLIKKLADEQEICWIWMAQNAHDVCGYYWLMSQLRDFAGRVFVLYLNNLPFINEKGQLFYPTNLFEIRPSEFLKAKKLARPITPGEFETDPDEWKKLCTDNDLVRTLEGGKKLVGHSVDYYDQALLAVLGKEPQKLTKVLHHFFTKSTLTTGDVFLVWRLKQLAKEDKIYIAGDWNKGWKDISIALCSFQQEAVYSEPS